MGKQADLGDLLVQARITNRLLAAQLKGFMTQQQLVGLLTSTGATAPEIADVLNTTSATVATTLKRIRRNAARK